MKSKLQADCEIHGTPMQLALAVLEVNSLLVRDYAGGITMGRVRHNAAEATGTLRLDDETNVDTIANRVQANFRAEQIGEGLTQIRVWSTNDHWKRLAPLWKATIEELKSRRLIVAEEEPAEKSANEKRGPYVGTEDKVKAVHRRMKNGDSLTKACKTVGTDSRTYYQYCLTVTGEDPIGNRE